MKRRRKRNVSVTRYCKRCGAKMLRAIHSYWVSDDDVADDLRYFYYCPNTHEVKDE
jgi:hypothetical protein